MSAIAILFAVIIVAVGIIIAVTSHQKKEMDFEEFADRFDKSAEEVLGEDVKKVSKGLLSYPSRFLPDALAGR